LKNRAGPALLLVMLIAIAIPLSARDVEITVEDTEISLPLEGAVVRSWDGSEHTCDLAGKAHIEVPDNRQVVIQAAYPGYDSGRLVITPGMNSATLGLRLSGVMEGRELIIEASRPGANETKTGRSVAVTEREIAQTAEIGIIEDVMTSIKLLPGVGYAGFFNAQPSIRGGDPGDMSASLDGYYIERPYHWGGGFSIFDPRMVQSAQLSHGVFSTRYGHTISGLLEITSKKPSSTETEFELGMNTSAANANLSLPLFGKGGILVMGRITYYDPVVALAKQMANSIPELEVINAVRQAPYIRSVTLTGNYRFYDDLELQATGFWGTDGIGLRYENGPETENGLTSRTLFDFDYANYQGFITAGLSWNPLNTMLLKFTAGTGYWQSGIDGAMENELQKSFSGSLKSNYPFLSSFIDFDNSYDFENSLLISETVSDYSAQGRLDWDWELGKGFLAAAGVQERYAFNVYNADMNMSQMNWYKNLDSDLRDRIRADLLAKYPSLNPDQFDAIQGILLVSYPQSVSSDADNKLFTTSGYVLGEYASPNSRFDAELGLRLDHFFLLGDGFSLQSQPALNPRLNLDFNVFKHRWIIESLDLSAGTGLFSSINNMASMAEKRYNLTEIKPNRSWTSVLGTKLEFAEGLHFNIEGYYKYVFDRTYIPVDTTGTVMNLDPRFDGEGQVWGIDVMLQKMQSRYWDGWISYSFNWAKYRDPHGLAADSSTGYSGGSSGADWYFPSYHRFHNLNLVLNIKPSPRFNIYTRFGFASGVQFRRRTTDAPESFPVYDLASGQFIEYYIWSSVPDENNRTTPSLPLDIKFSILGGNEKGKTNWELYVAVENVLALLYTSQGNTSFNSYTGKEDTGSTSASYEMPIPIPSFGFRISY
jgi:hypothetical protein